MITKKIFFYLTFVAALCSCKNDSNKTSEEEVETEKPKETFDVSFNLTVLESDVFQLYFTEDGTLNFTEDQSLKVNIKGSESSQDVDFKLPYQTIPTNIRLDFGQNEKQRSVKVNSMTIKYLDKSFQAKDSLVSKYFYLLDSQVKYNPSTSSIEILKTEGVFYDPLMWSNETLTIEMEKLIK